MKINKSTLDFLRELKTNNNREWFLANKRSYENSRKEFESYIDQIIAGVALFDDTVGHMAARDCIFRIYMDIRFSNDKSPYKTHLGAFLSPARKKTEIHSLAGYYIHIEPGGESMIAGGAYMPAGDWLRNIRKEIFYNGAELRSIVNNKLFRQYFGEIEGEKLKKPPAGFPPDHPETELLKLKSFTVANMCPDKLVLSDDFSGHCINALKILHPFNRFFNEVA
jgi:uncharacterized protein (TIGR02453 family)